MQISINEALDWIDSAYEVLRQQVASDVPFYQIQLIQLGRLVDLIQRLNFNVQPQFNYDI